MLHQPAPNENVTFYPFLQGAALHRKGTHSLCVLNSTAATVWCLLDGTSDKHMLAIDYAHRFQLKQLTALVDVETMLSDFWEMGLLQGAKIPQIAVTPTKPASIKSKKVCRPSATGLIFTSFKVADQDFTLCSNDEDIIRRWSRLINPLSTTLEGSIADPSNQLELLVLEDRTDPADPKGRFAFWKNNQLTADKMPADSVVPHIIYQVFGHVCARQQTRLLIHAAVLARNNHAIILPGQAGVGKSTLTAALAASGWTYLSSELALIDPNTLQVAPYPMPIGLKNKSVKPLADFIPDLAKEPVHTRTDGRQLRYFMPDDTRTQGTLPVAALVFPEYQFDLPAPELCALAPLAVLQALAATCSSDRPLAAMDIKALLALAVLPAYNLKFNDLKAAVADIEREIGERSEAPLNP